MPNSSPPPVFDETSPSIQTHLGILQGIVLRMATNSTLCKTWCITIVSAILVIVADKGKPDFAWIALFPSILFAGLDAYYLALEKGFRNSYDEFIKKLHTGQLTTEDLFSVAPTGRSFDLHVAALKSFSVWGFYLPLVALVAIARKVVLG
ncbi:MAG: hypothetical protein L0287_34030 [Anaerolineae bacterium]|nr:hypothetical protein [Anaerolineae bacterium]